ncbi:MAG: Gfo/Idh/MocA family oxidoreductase [Chthonomonadales bacterium]|nr:Gfo/Idh/MocA family oxidoreductase [Chthonomonadales bacterium]
MSVRIGIMSMAHMHAYSYAGAINEIAEAELVGIADHDLARARESAAQFSTQAFASYEDLLKADIQAVVIGSENVRHRELCEMAAAAGKHILCEKPLATTVADAEAMIAACRYAGVQLMTAFPCRFSPAMARLKATVDSGQAGAILAIRGTNRGRCPFGWFVQKELSGGGAVIDHTVHVTDLMRWITGQEVAEVYAETSNRMFGQDFEDIGFLTMAFDKGVFATLDSSWSRPKSFPTWGDVTMNVTCERGVLTLDMFSQNLVVYSDRTGGVSWVPWGSNIDLLMLQSFVAAVRDGTPVPITGEDGLRAVEVALAAYRSAESGKVVAVR